MSTGRLGFVVGVGMASAVAAGATFWVGRRMQPKTTTSAAVAAFCADSVRALPPTEAALREITCRVALTSALESLAARQYADSIDQIRTLEALLRPPPVLVAATQPSRSPSPPIAGVAEKPRDLMDPFASAEPAVVAPPPRRTAAPTMKLPRREAPRDDARDFMDPFALRNPSPPRHEATSTPPPPREPTAADAYKSPFAPEPAPMSPVDQAMVREPAARPSRRAGPVQTRDLMDPFASVSH